MINAVVLLALGALWLVRSTSLPRLYRFQHFGMFVRQTSFEFFNFFDKLKNKLRSHKHFVIKTFENFKE